jgi:hypothetical protein
MHCLYLNVDGGGAAAAGLCNQVAKLLCLNMEEELSTVSTQRNILSTYHNAIHG